MEWIELLKTHDAMRWNFINVIFNQIWQGLQVRFLYIFILLVVFLFLLPVHLPIPKTYKGRIGSFFGLVLGQDCLFFLFFTCITTLR